MNDIAKNIEIVHKKIAEACLRANRNPSDVTLVAISKRKPAGAIVAAAEAGLRHFGENRVEEANDKLPEVQSMTGLPLIWHMVGHIQSRKARDVVAHFDIVHSLDSLKLANKISSLVEDSGKGTIDVLLQINISGEASKSGFHATNWTTDTIIREQLWQNVKHMLGLPGLRIRGLMTMAPIVADVELARPVFADLMALRDALSESFDISLLELSMGMTDDYPVAIEEGATMVRVGRAIFGERE